MSTGIDYLDEVWNPITGCSGKGCKANCWARDMVKRFPAIHGIKLGVGGSRSKSEPLQPERVPFSTIQFHPDRLDKPLHWRKPKRIGVCFMSDWMDDQVQCSCIDDILDVISACQQHQFFTLTKQPQNLGKNLYGHCTESPFRELGGGDYLPNLWNGVSICEQEDADRMIPELLKVPGKWWVSIEPMLAPVSFRWAKWHPLSKTGELTDHLDGLRKYIDLVILGCESGPKRRPCPHEWMINVVRQCRAAGVPCFVKQVDINGRVSHNPEEWPEELQVQELPIIKGGKK